MDGDLHRSGFRDTDLARHLSLMYRKILPTRLLLVISLAGCALGDGLEEPRQMVDPGFNAPKDTVARWMEVDEFSTDLQLSDPAGNQIILLGIGGSDRSTTFAEWVGDYAVLAYSGDAGVYSAARSEGKWVVKTYTPEDCLPRDWLVPFVEAERSRLAVIAECEV